MSRIIANIVDCWIQPAAMTQGDLQDALYTNACINAWATIIGEQWNFTVLPPRWVMKTSVLTHSPVSEQRHTLRAAHGSQGRSTPGVCLRLRLKRLFHSAAGRLNAFDLDAYFCVGERVCSLEPENNDNSRTLARNQWRRYSSSKRRRSWPLKV